MTIVSLPVWKHLVRPLADTTATRAKTPRGLLRAAMNEMTTRRRWTKLARQR